MTDEQSLSTCVPKSRIQEFLQNDPCMWTDAYSGHKQLSLGPRERHKECCKKDHERCGKILENDSKAPCAPSQTLTTPYPSSALQHTEKDMDLQSVDRYGHKPIDENQSQAFPCVQNVNKLARQVRKLEVRTHVLEAAYKKPSTPKTAFMEEKNPAPLEGFEHHRVSAHPRLTYTHKEWRQCMRKSMTSQSKYQDDMNSFLRFGHQGTQHPNDMLYPSLKQKALSIQHGAEATMTLPHATQAFIEKEAPVYSPFRKIARTTSITTDTLELLVDKGDADVGWAQGAKLEDETQAPDLSKVVIPTHELFARPRASQKLLDDVSVNLESWIASKIAWQMGITETRAFLNGDGDGKPKGFLSYPTTPLYTPEWGKIETAVSGVAGALHSSDVLIDVMHALKPEYLQGAYWIMSRPMLAQVRKLKDKNDHYIWSPHLNEQGESTLLGYPVLICDDMPAPAENSISIAFGNFYHGYHIAERQDIQVLRDPYTVKPYVEFYATKRVGGDVTQFDAIKLVQLSEAMN